MVTRIAVAVVVAVLVAGCGDPEPVEEPRGVDYTTVTFLDPPGSHPVGVNPLDVLREASR